jgi:hypothetical protein
VRLEFGRTQSTISLIQIQLRELRDTEGWKQLTDHDGYQFMSWEQFVESEWLRIPAHVATAILEEHDLTKTIGDVATRAQRLAADPETKALAKHGRPAKGTNGNGDNVTFVLKGNSAEYIVRRLKRDAPEIAQALARGEFKSARAAGKAAGFIRDPTPFELAVRAIKKMDGRERAKLIRWIHTEYK